MGRVSVNKKNTVCVQCGASKQNGIYCTKTGPVFISACSMLRKLTHGPTAHCELCSTIGHLCSLKQDGINSEQEWGEEGTAWLWITQVKTVKTINTFLSRGQLKSWSCDPERLKTTGDAKNALLFSAYNFKTGSPDANGEQSVSHWAAQGSFYR